MRCLVIGRSGQLARALLELRLPREISVHAVGRPELDVRSPDSVARALDQIVPDIAVNAAAYTSVDEAERQPQDAIAINAEGAGVIGRATAARGMPVIHISTDYVYGGAKRGAYAETDAVSPINSYGQSKLAGELQLAEMNANHVILRTAWVYAPYGRNFLRTMLKMAQTHEKIRVVNDQWGNPTYASHLAEGIVAVASSLLAPQPTFPRGVYHMASQGETTWHGLAQEIFRQAAGYGVTTPVLEAITSAAFPTPARRPANSRLDVSKLQRNLGLALPDWRIGVRECVALMLGPGAATIGADSDQRNECHCPRLKSVRVNDREDDA